MGLSAALFASAQQLIFPGDAGKPGVAVDDFSNTDLKDFATPEGDYGIYFWKNLVDDKFPYFAAVADDAGTFGPIQPFTDGILKVEGTRKVGALDYVVSQPVGIYQPLGFGFGTIRLSATDSIKQSINLSAEAGKHMKAAISFNFDLAALATTTAGYKVKISLEDAMGKLIDSYGVNGGTENQYKDELYVVISKAGKFSLGSSQTTLSAKAKMTIEGETDGVGTVTFDFSGGYGSKYRVITAGPTKTNCPIPLPAVRGFDSTKVAGVQITVVAQEQVAGNCYQNVKLTDAKVSITRVAVGDLVAGNSDEQLFATKGFVAYPSPIEGGDVNFSATAENVKVYDVVGNVVFSAPSASKVNVDSFSKGLYIVKSSKGSTRFVVK